ncbi:FAD-binding oxidoreductase [Aspergillus saccharolyticus JOP 1030-1]|uniref:Putative FAD-binding oxidoreductase n=1 Tax=Aspergillus saccharolyticus JOP 1030-1 TaxID=1450539 RepID=A0A318Z955_9EURO|nr:putative FAD-binding oxidoreductase [Aspergillus saccharolyticus JOP 1030-1]PYH43915.1 putative FAD-binding oxidoreductase [Aspergillus saccharolyticus JOP 1030-1]
MDPVERVCQELAQGNSSAAILPSSSRYSALSDENWSATAWAKPSCIVQPRQIADLQAIVRLVTRDQVPFAIRSGGHMPSPLGANINRGVLIDMSGFNSFLYNSTSTLATVGMGQTWLTVYEGLEVYNRTAVGGRVPEVGVGGLLLGSGLSYLSDLYGLACDNVVDFEIVLANGSAVHANARDHADLFWALKGGANNFGIVTTATIQTYPMGPVWGGIKWYSSEQLPAVMEALYEYQTAPNKDPYANLMVEAVPLNSTGGVILNLVYLKPEPAPAAFAPFAALPTVLDTTQIQSFLTFMSGAVLPDLPRWDWHATSFTPSRRLYSQLADLFLSPRTTNASDSDRGSGRTGPLAQLNPVLGRTLSVGLQPISASAVLAGTAPGRGAGNALGLQPVNQTWLVLDIGWELAADDARVHRATAGVRAEIEALAQQERSDLEYIFMNDASWDQEVIAHYGEANVRRLREVQRRYDPDLVFQRLVPGGFKLGSGESFT